VATATDQQCRRYRAEGQATQISAGNAANLFFGKPEQFNPCRADHGYAYEDGIPHQGHVERDRNGTPTVENGLFAVKYCFTAWCT
jgi:hypothetical protein